MTIHASGQTWVGKFWLTTIHNIPSVDETLQALIEHHSEKILKESKNQSWDIKEGLGEIMTQLAKL